MTNWSEWLAPRVGELFWHSTVLLAAVSLALPWIRQPARRMTVCRASLLGLLLLIVMPAGIRDRAVIPLPEWVAFTGRTPSAASFRIDREDLDSRALVTAEGENSEWRIPGDREGAELRQNESGTDPDGDFAEFRVAPDDSVVDASEGASRRETSLLESPQSSGELPMSGVSSVPASREVPWTLIVSAIWSSGALLATAWIAVGGWRTWRLFRRSRRAPQWIHRELRSVVPERRHVPQLRVNGAIESALACGTLRPAILLPERNACPPNLAPLSESKQQPAGCLPSDEHPSADKLGIRAVLAHEWAHIANGDLWLLALERLLLPVYFAQPLFWLLRRRIRIDQELLADAAAARESPVEYAEALLAWAKSNCAGPRGEALAVLSFWNNPCHLSRRIEMLLDTTNRIVPQASPLWRGMALTVVLTLACGLSVLTFATRSMAEAQPAGLTVSTDDSEDEKAARETVKKQIAEELSQLDSSQIDKLQKRIQELQDEIHSLRQKSPPDELSAPASGGDDAAAKPPVAESAAARQEIARARERFEFFQRLAKKGYATQPEVDAAKADLAKAEALERAISSFERFQKGLKPEQFDEMRKQVAAMTNEIRHQKQRSSERTEAAKASDDRSIELQLLELDVNEAEVDVAAAKAEYDETAKLHEQHIISAAELNTRKLKLQKAEIALKRAKLRLEAWKRTGPRTPGKPTPDAAKLRTEAGNNPAAEAPRILTITIAATKDGDVESLSVGPTKLLGGPLDQARLLQLKHELQQIFAKTTEGYDTVILEASPAAKPKDLKGIVGVCMSQVSPDGHRVKNVKVVELPPNPDQAADKPAADLEEKHSLTIVITAGADGQVASLSVGLAKLFDGPLDENRLRMLDHRLKDVLAIEGKPYDAVILRAHRNLKYEDLIKVVNVCNSQKSADGKPIKTLSFAELAPNPDRPADKPAADSSPERSLTITVIAAADHQVESLSVGSAKLFDGPLDDQRLAQLDRRLQELFAESQIDAVELDYRGQLKSADLIKLSNVCVKQKSADGRQIREIRSSRRVPNPEKRSADGGAQPQSPSRIPGAAEKPEPKSADDSEAAKPADAPTKTFVNAVGKNAPAQRFTMAHGLGDPLPLLAPLLQQTSSLDDENRVLARWTAAAADIRRLEVEFGRFVYDGGSQIETRSEGILTLEPPSRAAYVLLPTSINGHVSKKIGNDRSPFTLQSESHEQGWIWTGMDVVHLDLKSRTYETSRFPAEGAVKTSGVDFLLARPFLLGLPVAELREQFNVALIKSTATEFWLSFVPRQPELKRTFSRAILILDGAKWLPKALKITDDAGQIETVHTFLRFTINGPQSSGGSFDKSKLAREGYLALATPKSDSSSQTVLRRAILPSLVDETAHLAQQRLGLAVAPKPVQNLPAILAGKFRGGLQVVSVESNGPAEASGIRDGDVLVGIHVWEMAKHQDLKYALTNWKAESESNTADAKKPMRVTLLRGTDTMNADLHPRP